MNEQWGRGGAFAKEPTIAIGRRGRARQGRAGQGEAGQGPTTVFAAIGPTDGLCVERPWLGSQSGS